MQTAPPPQDAFIGPVDDRGHIQDAFADQASASSQRGESPDPEPQSWPLATAHPTGTWLHVRPAGDQAEVLEPPLAAAGTALAELYALAASRRLSPLHPPAVMAEAAAVVADPGIDDPSLDDLTHLPFFTIDEPHSKDLDQALCIEPGADGDGFRVWYAIADAAWCVRPGTALFAEALHRGATYYLPGLVIPMLPKALSEGVVSLNPGVDRRALVFDIALAADGQVITTQLRRGRIRSRVKTSYDAVQAYLDGAAPLPGDEPAIAQGIDLLRQVGQCRMHLAEARDVISIRRQEIALSLRGKQGLRFVAMADPRNDVERYNEQISLLCNIEGARFLARGDRLDDDIHPIYRVHDPPTRERLDRFEREVRSLVKLHRLDTDTWCWRRRHQSLAAYLKSLPIDGPHPLVAKAIHRQAMLTGGRSLYDTAPGYHFGVGADSYARFTAPMREVVGIFCHKEAWEKLGKAEPNDRRTDAELQRRILVVANEAKQTQRILDRETNRMVLDQLFEGDLQQDGPPAHRGVILGVSRSKVHVGLEDPPIDVKVYLSDLQRQHGCRLRQGRDTMTVRRSDNGRRLYTVGEAVEVRVRQQDADRDRWALDLIALAP